MNKQLRQAFATNQIDMNQYQQQFAELNGYVKSIDQQEEVLQALPRTSPRNLMNQ